MACLALGVVGCGVFVTSPGAREVGQPRVQRPCKRPPLFFFPCPSEDLVEHISEESDQEVFFAIHVDDFRESLLVHVFNQCNFQTQLGVFRWSDSNPRRGLQRECAAQAGPGTER